MPRSGRRGTYRRLLTPGLSRAESPLEGDDPEDVREDVEHREDPDHQAGGGGDPLRVASDGGVLVGGAHGERRVMVGRPTDGLLLAARAAAQRRGERLSRPLPGPAPQPAGAGGARS